MNFEIAQMLLLKMVGLYLAIAIGYIAVKKLDVSSHGISRLLFYVIVPLVFLHGIAKMRMQGEVLLLPVVIAMISCTLCLTFYRIAKCFYDGKEANIIGFASGNGNIGYFGIPVALLLFDEQTVAIYMVMIIGIMLYEGSLGYYITTKGDFSTRQALMKIATLPMLHGALGGIVLSMLEWPLPEFMEDFFISLRGAYTTLGMMVVGMGLAAMQRIEIDWRFLGMTFAVKFLAWPVMIAGCIWLDQQFFGLFSENIHRAATLLSVVPLAVNSVIFATLLNAHPEKMATAVFASTAFAIFYVPFMVSWLIL